MPAKPAITSDDVAKVTSVAGRLPPAAGSSLEEDYVMNLLVAVVDYMLKTAIVVRALRHFRDNRWDEIRTLDDLEGVLGRFRDDEAGNTALARHLWGYRLWTRAEQLRGLARYFRSIGVTDQERLVRWAQQSSFEDDFEGRVKGLGRAVYESLLMRQGVDTVKPDVHVRRFAESAVGRPLSDADVIQVVTRAAHRLGIKAYELDWRIWEASQVGRSTKSE
jgi:hypothetical protein